MTEKNDKPISMEAAAELRLRAEAKARAMVVSSALEPLSLGETRAQVHELQVHQIELEMQNEALRQAQLELDAARAVYFDLYDRAPVGYCTVDAHGLLRQANLPAAALLGVTRDALVRQRLTRFILPADQDIYYLLRKQLGASGEPQTCDLRLVQPGGSQFWAHLVITAARDHDGEPVLRVVISDISDRKRAEAALQDSEARFRAMIEWAPVAIGVLRGGRFIYANPAAIALFEAGSAQALVDRPILDLIHPDDHPGTPGSESAAKRYHKFDGAALDLECHATELLYDAEIAVLMVFHDMTARRRLEHDKARLEAQLLQAMKMQLVGRLAGGVAHDFNNMLAVILGHTGFILDQMAPAHPLHADLEAIHGAAQHSADLTRQLLTFARKQTIAPKVLSLNDALASLRKMLEGLVGENIQLHWRLETKLWSTLVDPSQLDQILSNLCLNARDAITDVGTVTIETANCALDAAHCAAIAGATPGEYVRLTVRDSGSGMDRDTLAQIFEPFFTTKEVGKGTGLGLATVHGAIQQNHGFIHVSSAPGHGTTFEIYLPRHLGATAAAQPGAPKRPASRGLETILVVEDEAMILRLLTRALGSAGYVVLAVPGPGEALRLAQEHTGPIHLLLTDVVMPEMNGRDLAKRILALHPRVQCLFMSGYTADILAHDGVLTDAMAFIAKPFMIDDLTASVRRLLDAAIDSSALARSDPPLLRKSDPLG